MTYALSDAMLPVDHLERLFGRDMHRSGWQIDIQSPANDDTLQRSIDPAMVLKLLKRRMR